MPINTRVLEQSPEAQHLPPLQMQVLMRQAIQHFSYQELRMEKSTTSSIIVKLLALTQLLFSQKNSVKVVVVVLVVVSSSMTKSWKKSPCMWLCITQTCAVFQILPCTKCGKMPFGFLLHLSFSWAKTATTQCSGEPLDGPIREMPSTPWLLPS